MKNKHVKRTNRTLKKTAVASILVGLLTAVIAPTSIAASNGPDLFAIVADRTMSNVDVQTITTMWDDMTFDLTADDIELTGTAMGCTIDPFDPSGFVIQFNISGCSDGTLGVRVKDNAVVDSFGQPGPINPAPTLHLSISRTPPIFFLSEPAVSGSNFVFHIQAPSGVRFFNPLAVSFTDANCQFRGMSFSETDIMITVGNCGAAPLQAQLWPYSLTDLYGNVGPVEMVTSLPIVVAEAPGPAPTPTPTPTSMPAPEASVLALPVVEPVPVVTVPPAAEPVVVQPEPIPTPTLEPTPTPTATPTIEPTVAPTLEPRITPAETHSNQQQLIAAPQTSAGPPSGGAKQIVVHPVRLSEIGRAFDWSPIANGLIATALALAATAGVVALRRVRVRRLAIG